ncbi:MAG: type II secretion system protein [Candidatus Rifleibacteriota bacterium]
MQITEKKGLTLLELVVCTLIIGILASTALPLSKNLLRHEKEQLLRDRLREIRYAIDRFYQMKVAKIPGLSEKEAYPASLQELVENRMLRRIPIDPMTGKADWRIRSTTDEITAELTDGTNVFDVTSTSGEIGSDGQPYFQW